ncbi:MAG: LysR substrate-binding domain-containing protein [Polyangiaceae bacterium]
MKWSTTLAPRLTSSTRSTALWWASPPEKEYIALPELSRRYPGLRIELDISSELADLNRREADVALRLVRPSGGDLVVTRLMTLAPTVLASPEVAKRVGAPRDLTELQWIGWPAGDENNAFSGWLSRHAPGVEPVLRTPSIEAQIVAAEAGLGVALLPDLYKDLRRLAEVPLTGPLAEAAAHLPKIPVWLVGHRALREVPRIKVVWEHILDAARALG